MTALGISDRLAGSAEEQSAASRQLSAAATQELALGRLPAVDAWINFKGVENGTLVPEVRIINTGYSIYGAEFCQKGGWTEGKDLSGLWASFSDKDCRRIDIVPGGDHAYEFENPTPTAIRQHAPQGHWASQVFRLTFKDAAGKTHVIRRCLAYRGGSATRETVRNCYRNQNGELVLVR